ncbi:CLASP N terminal family protein [Leishmania donovani]|uniref:CLASP N terminal family protein n=1 Tax=Leishmania donovani TaxID=5661 RepID=A0A504XLW8_LEIDO|nr:CLASP N terminal family protein [Leishmania donovani]
MAHTSSVALTDEEVLRRVQLLGDAIAEEQRQTKPSVGLRQPSRDWHIQVRLLEEVTCLLADDISGRRAFVGWMSLYMRNCLLHALQSRRAPIALAAVNAVGTVVQHGACRAAVAVVCSWFLACLVRLAASSSATSAVSAAAMCVLLSMAQKCVLTLEGVNSLLCDCGAPSAAVRRRSLEVLRSYLEAAKGTSAQLSVKAYTEAVRRVISDRMRDADAEVRRAARRCFWALHVLEPASTGALLRVLPAGLQRQLAAERADAMQELKAVELPPAPPTSPSSALRSGRAAHRNPHALDAAHASRTVTLKDDLQSAVACRARAVTPRSTSPSKARRQLLRSAKEAAAHQQRRTMLPTPHLCASGPGTFATSTGSTRLYAASRRAGGGTSLLTSMESTDWSIRRAAVLEGQRLCESGSLMSEDIAQLLTGLLIRVQDIHFRVVEAAQNFLRTLMARAPTATQNEFQSLLPFLVSALVRNTSHARPVVRAGARHLLDRIARTHEPPLEVLKAVLRAADDVGGGSAAMDQRCAELLHYVIVVHPSLFAETSSMGIAVRGILAHLRALESRQPKESSRAGVRVAQVSWFTALGAALLACPESFRQIAERLAPSEQEEVRAALRESFGLMDKDWEGKFSDVCAIGNERLRCLFAEELKACAMTERGVTGTFEPLPGADRRMTRGGGASDVAPLSSRALQNASMLLREFLSVDEARLLSSGAARELPEDAVAGAASTPVLAALPELARPANASCAPSPVLAGVDGGDESSVAHATVSRRAWPGPQCGRDPVAHFLRQRPYCRDTEERRCALLSLAEALRAGGPGAERERGADVYRPDCVPEDVERLLVYWERELSGVEGATHHNVRWAMVKALQALLQWPAARSAVSRQLTRVFSICRAGLDDPFLEAQLQAACCLDTLLTVCKPPADLCLSAIASCVMRWLEGPMGDGATSGWLELVHMNLRVVEQAQPSLAGVKGTNRLASVVLPDETDYQRHPTLTAAVLHRVVAVLNCCLNHCHVSVRLCAVLVLVGIRRALGDAVTLPFLAPLSAAHMRLVDVYLDKVMEERPWRLLT